MEGSNHVVIKGTFPALPGGTEEIHEKRHSEYPVSGPRFELHDFPNMTQEC
jgi:hypothetical protein